MKIAAIDYGLNSPVLGVEEEGIYHFYFFAQRKKHKNFDKTVEDKHGMKYHFKAFDYPEYETREGRYEEVATLMMGALESHKTQPVHKVLIEGFAFYSMGRSVSGLYETGAIIRNKLFKANYDIHEVPPTALKKVFSGKGSSNKLAMYRTFEAETGIDLFNVFDLKMNFIIPKPIEDIVDCTGLLLYESKKAKMPTKEQKKSKLRVIAPLLDRLNGVSQKGNDVTINSQVDNS